ncbi:M20/M25/M40 family metallo-hydrolase [Pseudoxanthobacter sp. M-2]|uniref:M20/M25/M40 family metallo-hydrolase n=1 Tax=Pseudoxanthobacter sp. M-2 TaxID=3078754 RepID=UPI0038FD2866
MSKGPAQRSLVALAFAVLAPATFGLPAAAQTAPSDTVATMERHLDALQTIADENGGNRAAGTPGYRASVDYAAKVLERAGYAVTRQRFEVKTFELTRKPVVAKVRPEARRLRDGKDYLVFDYSGSAEIQGPVVPARGIRVPPPANGKGLASGCSADDFPAETRHAIALVQRGGCFFTDKIENARRAGAKAILIFNTGLDGETAPLSVTAGEDNDLPAVFLSYGAGRDLYRSARQRRTVVRLDIRGTIKTKATWNVIADTAEGDPDRTLVVGAHLDSVPEGPGINDNGSGTALVLAAAEDLAKRSTKPRNRVRFALWAAEEIGLLGSTHYVLSLSKRERARIFAYLNFDMVGSPNYVRFIDRTRGDARSEAIGALFEKAFARRGLGAGHVNSKGMTDTASFLEAGIPTAGLFAGTDDLKTKSQQRRYGGTAGEPYDACYHRACDTTENISRRALEEFSDAALRVIRQMARRKPSQIFATTSVEMAAPAATAEPELLYRGPYALR